MPLSPKTQKRLGKAIDSAATLQLATEHAADLLTYSVVAGAGDRLVAAVATRATSRADALPIAAGGIHQAQAQLVQEFEAAMKEARAIGREFAMRQLQLELEPAIAAGTIALTPALARADIEAMWARHAATGMARAFGTKAIGEAMLWQNSREEVATLAKRLSSVTRRVEDERKKHVVSQSVGAFTEAKRDTLKEMKEARAKQLPGIPGTGGGKGGKSRDYFDDGVRELWSAILDVKTCPVCWKHDGEMVKVGKPFTEGARTPLHGHCRCTVVTLFMPEELERYMAGAELDYEALKADVKDYMGSHKFDVGQGVRHAKGYVVEVLERRGHSPHVLADRFNNRKAYFPNVARPVVPTLLW